MTLLFSDTAWTVIGQMVAGVLTLITLVITLRVKKKTEFIADKVNGHTELLIEAVGKAKKAEGKEEGIAEQKLENKENNT